MRLDRTNTGVIGRWWWTIDRPALGALTLLIVFGSILVTAASPPVAHRLHLPMFYFVHRHQVFLALAFAVMLGVSLLPAVAVRRLAVLGFAGSIVLMMLVPVIGTQVKGAHRWISLAGVSIQPSEFMKPCFAVVMAWICAEKHRQVSLPGNKMAIALYVLVVALLLAQPDFGMTLTVTVMWSIQFFLAGLPFFWVLVLIGGGALGIAGAYHFFPHVAARIDRFLDPASGDNYQVAKSLEAFRNGGIFGRGPGEGDVKQFLPDSHTDFVFSVAGEEFGMVFCLMIVALFAFVVLRALYRVRQETDLFAVLAVTGLAVQFGVQAIINMGVAVNLLPAKGMTLPFVSYGGSSVIAIALGMGMLLSLTRKRFGITGGRRV
ncbi:MAG: putative lipid II flippase FtsW [Alphaproteobacteria bacterium]|nr:putative lipid II flippase FtsW [Alphaproteobacteria bacterium]